MYLSVGVRFLFLVPSAPCFLVCAREVAVTAVTCMGKTFASNQAGKNQNLTVLQ